MSAPRIFTPEYYARLRALEARGWWNAGMRDIQAMLLARVGLPPTGVVVDVGCGSGQTLSWLTTLYPAWRGFGVDVSRDGLRAARATLSGSVAGGSALRLPFPDGVADLVICLDVLQHLPLNGGDVVALGEMRRVLRTGGALLLRTNAQAFPRAEDDPAAAFHKYTPSELRDRLRRCGFRVHRLSRVNALLGLAEIPRELRARHRDGRGYHGVLAREHASAAWLDSLKRRWLRLEGNAIAAGVRWPVGRTLLAVCQAPGGDGR